MAEPAAVQDQPVGYRFDPTVDELFHYLLRKNRGEEDTRCVIPELDLYSYEPEELGRKFHGSSIIVSNDPQWWFFCEQRPGPTQQRLTKGGYWKKTGSTRDVKSRNGTEEVIGSKKILIFFRGKSSSSTKTDWIMHEYDLKGNVLNSSPLRKNYVLCMIKCKSDETANSTPAYEWERNISDFLLDEPVADDGSIPEHMVQDYVQSLVALCRKEGMADEMVAPAAMQHLPLGYRFHPTDEELLGHYLLMKNRGEEVPNWIIPEFDLCSWEPEALVRYFRESSIVQSNGPQWWFFCKQRPGPTQQRSTEGGHWKITGKTRAMKCRNGTEEVIGSKKILIFFRGKSSSSTKTDWIMHEYDLKGNVLNSSPLRKNYVLCMIKCKSDETANSTPAYEWERNISDFLLDEPVADDGSIPEPMVQAQMQSLEALCWIPNHGYRAVSIPFLETCTNSADSLHMQFLRAGDSIKSEQPAVIMENKQSQKLEPLYPFLPTDEKKGIVEHNLPQLTTSVQAEAPKVKIEEECIEMISQANQKHTHIKIEEISISNAGSSSTSIHKPRKPVMDATCTAKGEDTNTMAALGDHEKPARELKLEAAETEPVSCSYSQSIRQRSSSSQSMVYAWNLLVGIVLCFVIFREMFKPLIF